MWNITNTQRYKLLFRWNGRPISKLCSDLTLKTFAKVNFDEIVTLNRNQMERLSLWIMILRIFCGSLWLKCGQSWEDERSCQMNATTTNSFMCYLNRWSRYHTLIEANKRYTTAISYRCLNSINVWKFHLTSLSSTKTTIHHLHFILSFIQNRNEGLLWNMAACERIPIIK